MIIDADDGTDCVHLLIWEGLSGRHLPYLPSISFSLT